MFPFRDPNPSATRPSRSIPYPSSSSMLRSLEDERQHENLILGLKQRGAIKTKKGEEVMRSIDRKDYAPEYSDAYQDRYSTITID